MKKWLIVYAVLAVLAPLASLAATDCSKSDLRQEKLLDMLHAVVMHGDLTDVPFIESALQTKLIYEDHGNTISTDRRIYKAQSLLGAPVLTSLNVGFNFGEHSLNNKPRENTLRMDGIFGDVPIVFHDCRHIAKESLEKTFGGEFMHMPAAGVGSGKAS